MTLSIMLRPTRSGRLLAAATVAATSALALVSAAPAGAGGVASAVATSSSVPAAEVLFWARSNSIVKASVAAPTVVATVLAGSDYPRFSDPEVSPDGTKLAYVKATYVPGAEGPTDNLEVRDLATGMTKVLATTPPTFELSSYHFDDPTWSPTGETIAYVYNTIGLPGAYYPTVKVVAASGGPSSLVDGVAAAAAWRPDGALTVARYDPEFGTFNGLWVTGATPDDAVLIPGSADAHEHSWSPDGTQVVFTKYAFGPPVTIVTLPAAGGTPTVLVPHNESNASPVWSSDQQRVYFTQGATPPGAVPTHIRQVPNTGGAISTVVAGGSNVSPSVTTMVAAPVPSAAHDFNGDGYADVIGRTSTGDLRLYYGDGLGLSGGYRRIGTGWGSMTAIFSPGDFDGEGHPDIIGRTSNGELRLYTGAGGGPPGYRRIGTGWGSMTAVFSPGDFDGDSHSDVIGRTSTGELRLYTGAAGGPPGYRVIGTGWHSMTAVFSPGDLDGDSHSDVIGRTSTGELRLYTGAAGGPPGYRVIGTGWNGLSALFSPGDFNLDGKPDVIGRTSTGDLRVYYGFGARLSGYRVIGTGWNSLNPLL